MSRTDNRTVGEGRAAASSMRDLVRKGPVSVVTTSSTAAGSVPADPVRALQHTLYRAAKADPGRRFHALRDKIFRKDVLWRAWVAVFRNDGAPGIDRATLADVEEYGVARLLDELAAELKEGGYRPLPARRVLIPKPGTAEQRPLSIPTRVAYCAAPQACRGFGNLCHGDAPVSPAGGSASAGVVRAEAGRRCGAELRGRPAGVVDAAVELDRPCSGQRGRATDLRSPG